MRSATVEHDLPEESFATAAPDFDRLAHIYRWMEWFSFGPFLQRCRCAFLGLLGDRRTALVLGDGDGRFTAQLFDANPHVTVDAVDASGAMLSELRRRAGSHSNRLLTHLSDARAILPMRHDYDLVATHFFLDCLTTEEVERLAGCLRAHATDDAVWVISEFAMPSGRYGQALAPLLIGFLYRAFGWLTGLRIRHLPNHNLALTQAGWRIEQRQTWLGGLLLSERWRINLKH